jgi:hypothetical protein
LTVAGAVAQNADGPVTDVDARSQLEARKRTLLSNVERALLDALAESPDVHRSIWRLQKAGFTLRLSIECHESNGESSTAETPASPPNALESPHPGPRPSPRPITFRIDADDLGFLRSIGIDPTRRPRPRRKT